MSRRLVMLCFLSLFLCLCSAPAFATLTEYQDFDEWYANIPGEAVVEYFDDADEREFPENFNETGFNYFSLTGKENGGGVAIIDGGDLGTVLAWRYDEEGGPEFSINFNPPVKAVGFSWFSLGGVYRVTIDGQSYSEPPFIDRDVTGDYWGVISDKPFSKVTFSFVSLPPDSENSECIINEIRSVPDPNSVPVMDYKGLIVFGVLLIGAGALYLRRKKAGVTS